MSDTGNSGRRRKGEKPVLHWDDAQMRTSYSNICNVASTREEMSVFFGVNQAWQGARAEVTVQLSDRIILSPFAAKRLSILLQQVVAQHEQRFGALDVVAPAHALGTVDVTVTTENGSPAVSPASNTSAVTRASAAGALCRCRPYRVSASFTIGS